MTSDALTAVSADLDIQFASLPDSPVELALEALRAFRLIGWVFADAESTEGSVAATLAFVPGRGLAVATDDDVATTPAAAIVTALAARLGAAVHLTCGDDEYAADAPETDAVDVAPPAVHETQVFVVGGGLSLAPDRRAELALQLGSALTVIPSGVRTIVVPDEPMRMPSWPRGQRPVISVRRSRSQLAVQIYSEKAARAGRARERLAMTLIPDWIGLWDPAPLPIVTGDERSAAADVQRRLDDERRATLAELGIVDDDVIAETGIDGARLRAALVRPLDDDAVREVVAALRLPVEVADLLDGAAAAEMTGAVVIPLRSIGGTIADSLLSEPEGTGIWARWRRLPHRRPGLAAVLIAAELAAAAGAVMWASSAPMPWRIGLWVVAGILAIDAIGDAVLLSKIRRRASSRGEA